MKRVSQWFSALLILLVWLPVQAEKVRLTTEAYPPFNMSGRTGEITGISTDIVRELCRRAGVDYSIELMPWVRAYNEALEHANVGVFSTTRTPEREALFKWVSPLTFNNWVFMAKASRNIRLASLEEAKRYRIGGYKGDAVAVFLQSQGFELDLVNRDDLNALKLARERIDLWATGHLMGPYLASKQNIKGLRPIFTFKETTMGLAFSKKTPDKLINQLNATLKSMYADGTIDRIYEGYR